VKAKVTVLGCSGSSGVPAIGNYWGACDPAEPRNRRTRTSIAVQTEKTTLVVDTGPEFHLQMNRENIKTCDAVLYTHAHADHVAGIEELRGITIRNQRLTPIYANAWTLEDLTRRFEYLFKGGMDRFKGGYNESYPPVLTPHEITPAQFGKPMTIGDLSFIPFEQDHQTCKTLGFRFGEFGYSTDIFDLNDVAIGILKGVKIWVVDAAGYKDTAEEAAGKPHATLETIYRLHHRIGAGQVYITHLSLAMDYRTLLAELPDGYAPAYDGLNFAINL
jgi:phosphoribosyl 1,2-cyclic phosphate phosphodiesterase